MGSSCASGSGAGAGASASTGGSGGGAAAAGPSQYSTITARCWLPPANPAGDISPCPTAFTREGSIPCATRWRLPASARR